MNSVRDELRYFEEITPSQILGKLNIASRPSKRKQTKGVSWLDD